MKSTLAKATAMGAALLLIGCPTVTTNKDPAPQSTPTTQATQGAQTTQATQSPQLTAEQATATCMTCHGEGTDLGMKTQNAREGWQTSLHARGPIVPLKDSTGAAIAHEAEGSTAFYANGGSCQVCHTKEGFLLKVGGKYTATSPAASDSIQYPSSITCFSCHRPHANGNFDLVVANGTKVTLDSGAEYSKAKGSICVNCHQSRGTSAGAEADVITAAKGNGISARGAGHHGPNTDMLLGSKAGAQYAGKTYNNGPHTASAGADCIACHMTYPDARLGGTPNLAGHSFNTIAAVHGTQKGNTAGCTPCHGTAVTSAVATESVGHIKVGDAYFAKGSGTQPRYQINTLLTALADPTKDGAGLLQQAYELSSVAGAGKKITWNKDTWLVSSLTSQKDASASADSPKVRFGKALHNYLYVMEDGSNGVHNGSYAKQLLWDSADDLKTLIGVATPDIGTRP